MTAVDEIDLRSVVFEIWSNRRVLLLSTMLAVVFAICYLQVARPVYESQMLISPAQGQSSSQLNIPEGIASLAGLNLGDDSGGDFEKFKVLLTSRALSAAVIENTDLMPMLFSSQWNKKDSKWQKPGGVTALVKRPVSALLAMPPWHQPDVEELMLFLGDNLDVQPSPESSMIVVSFRHKDPKVAQKVLTEIHEQGDNIVRNQERRKAEKRVDKLIDILGETRISEHRQAIITLLSEEQRRLLMAQVDRHFVADLIDPPSYPTLPASPRPRIFVAIVFMLGLFAGLGYISIRAAAAKNKATSH